MKSMNAILSIAIMAVVCATSITIAGEKGRSLPLVDLKSLDGSTVNTEAFENDGNPIILNFWATWCKPCIRELSAIKDMYIDWQEETGVKIIAVSIDDARNSSKVAPFINGRGWEYEVYLDVNSDLKRAMNVNNVPHTFVLNGKKEIVWEHNSYAPGDEEELYEVVKGVKNKKSSGE